MKKFIIIFSIFLFIFLCFNTVGVIAESQSKTLTQGIYNVKNANLLIDTPINVSITPSNSKAIILVIDSDQTIEALVRLNPQITKQTLPPLKYDSWIVIFSNSSVIFS